MKGGKKNIFLQLVLLTYLCLCQVFKDPFVFRKNFLNINNSIKQNQAIKKIVKLLYQGYIPKAEQ